MDFDQVSLYRLRQEGLGAFFLFIYCDLILKDVIARLIVSDPIVDLFIKGGNGFEIVRSLRPIGSQYAVIEAGHIIL